MKFFKVSIAIAAVLAVAALLYLGVRLVPGMVVFAAARDLAVDAGFEGYSVALALIAGGLATAILVWRGFSWRKIGVLLLVLPLLMGGFLGAKSFLRDQPRDVSDPDAVRWFGVDGRARLYYARQPDGSFIFSARPGHDTRSGAPFEPVTPAIREQWRQLKAKQSAEAKEQEARTEQLARRASEAEEQRKALDAQIHASEDKLRAEKEARAETERQLQQQAQAAIASAAKLAKQAHEAEEKGKGLEAQVRVVEEKLCEQSKARRTCEQELQRQAGEAFADTAKIQAEVEDAKRQLKEQLAQRTSELEQMRQGLEARLRAEEDKQREKRERKSNSEIQRQLQEATALANRIQQEAQEQKRRAEKTGEASSSRKPAASAPPPPPQNATVTIGIRNETRFNILITFSSRDNRGWQEPGRAWMVGTGQTVSLPLAGFPGDPVYYKAWAAENPYIQWGQNTAMATCGGADPPLLCLVERR